MTRDRSPAAGTVFAIGLALLLSVVLPLPVAAQHAPAPVMVSDALEVEVDAGGADVDTSWTITAPAGLWRLEAAGPPGETVRLELLDPHGRELGRSHGADEAALFDRALAPGSYTIRLRRGGVEPFPVRLSAGPGTVRFGPEPNDLPETAIALEDDVERTGRLARTNGDEDLYALVIPAGDSNVRAVSLGSSGDLERELCLIDSDRQRLQFRRGVGRVSLPDLMLQPGDYQPQVRGSIDASIGYAHAVTIEGEPQLWRVVATGDEVDQLGWLQGGDTEVAQRRRGCGSSEPAVLEDLYLLPGTYRFKVRTCSGAYRPELVLLDPPHPDGEREPNDDDVTAEAYRIGERRTGRLPSVDDIDQLRFTLAAPEHLRLRLRQPPDSDIDLRLWTGGAEIFRQRALQPGADLDVDMYLAPGDYRLALRPRQPSEGVYAFDTERVDPFVIPADAEPNGDPGTARPAPGSLRWAGTAAGAEQDTDAWWLPPLERPGLLRIRVDGERPRLRLFSDGERSQRVELVAAEDGSLVAEDAPLATPLYLELLAEGPYAVELEAPGWTPSEPPLAPPLEVVLTLDHGEDAADWPQGQQVAGTVTLTNAGAEDLHLELQAWTSHYAWRLRIPEPDVALPAGATVEIPVELSVDPDVRADVPVRISVAAVDQDGGLVSASTDVAARP